MEHALRTTVERLTFRSRRQHLCVLFATASLAALTGCAQVIATENAGAAPRHLAIPDSVSPLAVVNIGYGVQVRGAITGAVSSVSLGTSSRRAQVSSLAQLLQGRIAGLEIQPRIGGGTSMRVRGGGSFFGEAPLVVVDGNPLPAGVALEQLLEAIDPNDGVRGDVLKDVSATAIYGTRGSGGVVLITMRKRAH